MANSPRINGSNTRKSPRLKNVEQKSQAIECESSKEKANASKTPAKKASSALKCKEKKRHEKLEGKRYPLRSSLNGVRILRSMSSSVSKSVSPAPASTTQPVNLFKEKRKKKKRVKNQAKDEYDRIRIHVRYLLKKINYEQSLIDAYDTEGWKGLSMEKIRPEKELQRAKKEILHCKFRIRGQFKQLGALLSEGKLEDNLFDSEGQISSEDIICAICASKQSAKNNDIILCDGVCDRGFHQKCLTPSLLDEDIPPGDEGWLCPGCDCKIDCIDFINDLLALDLLIEDAWEEVFPEAAVIAPGDTPLDDLGLPSDDSEDDDYAPDGPECLDVGCEDDDDAENSEESFTSEDSVEATDGLHSENFGFPSDDSDDNDFDPNEPNLIMKSEKDGSSSDESDCTSNTNDLKNEISDLNEDLTSQKNHSIISEQSSKESLGKKCDKALENAELFSSMDPDVSVLSATRNLKRLDYKRLYDETFSHSSSESGEDDDWYFEDPNTKGKIPSESTCPIDNQRNHMSMNGKPAAKNDKKLTKHSSRKNKSKTVRHGSRKSSSISRFFSSSVCQKLQESFKENQYPNHEKKKSLADGLGMTHKQVHKWFDNTRQNFRASNKETTGTGLIISSRRSITTPPSTLLVISSSPSKSTTATPPINTKNKTPDKRLPADSIKNDITPKKEANSNIQREAKVSPINRQELVMRELRKRKRQK